MTIRMIAAATAAAAAIGASGAAHADVYMKVSSTPGDARTAGFEQQIVLTGASLNISSYMDYGFDGQSEPVRAIQATPIYLNKAPDRSSPKLMVAAIKGGDIGTIEITFTSPNRAGAQVVESRWILEGAQIRSFNLFPGADGVSPASETFELAYKTMRYQYFTTDAKGVRTGAMEEVTWDSPEGQTFAPEGCG
jgi:type VI protein secretion system component Hcp